MKTSTLITAAVVVATAGLGVYVAHRLSAPPHKHQLEQRTNETGEIYYTCPMHPEVRQGEPGNCPICGMKLAQRKNAGAATDREPLYWYDPMRPEVHFDAPGRSPFMEMDLVPKFAEGSDETIVTVDPRMAQNLGMRTAPVRRGGTSRTLEAVGSVRIDERRRLTVESRTAGWIETLNVRAEGDPVRKGQPLATLYSPELLAAERELALARTRGDAGLVAASQERLKRLAGGRDSTLRAPSDGVVTSLMAREGAQLAPGMPLMEIADLSTVWILIEVPEAQSTDISVGQPAEARLPALPGETFRGTVDYLYPELVPETRSLRARLIFDNADGRLRPGMYARVALQTGTAGDALLVPSEALIRTGRRSVVMVAEATGRYRPVHVVPGADLGAETVILEGLTQGQRVVVSGQFLLDSEASLLGAYRRLSSPDDAAAGMRKGASMMSEGADSMDHGAMDHGAMQGGANDHAGSPARERPQTADEHAGQPAESRAPEAAGAAPMADDGMEHGGDPAEARPTAPMEHGGNPVDDRPAAPPDRGENH